MKMENAAAEPTDQLAVNSPQTPRPESRYAKPNRYPFNALTLPHAEGADTKLESACICDGLYQVFALLG